jgi:hypothetical protein
MHSLTTCAYHCIYKHPLEPQLPTSNDQLSRINICIDSVMIVGLGCWYTYNMRSTLHYIHGLKERNEDPKEYTTEEARVFLELPLIGVDAVIDKAASSIQKARQGK